MTRRMVAAASIRARQLAHDTPQLSYSVSEYTVRLPKHADHFQPGRPGFHRPGKEPLWYPPTS